MKNRHKTIGIIAALSIASLFGSCSRETTSIGESCKLANAQCLAKNIPSQPTGKSEYSAQLSPPQKEAEIKPVIAPVNKNIDLRTVPAKKTATRVLVQAFSQKAEKVILKQASVVSRVATNHALTSTSSPKDRGGLLSLAIVFLIIGVVLFFLGFASLGALFWTIGLILLVIALIFFLLWMIGRAVSE